MHLDKRLLRVLLLLLLGLALVAAYRYRDRIDTGLIDAWLQQAGLLGPMLFVALYALATVLFLPGAIMTLTGGALFGPAWGFFYNLIGATLGSALAFLISRYLGGDWIARSGKTRLHDLIRGVEAEGWRFVAFVRLVPLFPFNMINYALGLTRISFYSYTLTSFIAMAPGVFVYTYFGHAGREIFAEGGTTARTVLFALALLAILIFLPRLIRSIKQARHE